MPFKITFEYDEFEQKWDCFAENSSSAVEAVQGFNAVIITCRDATPSLATNKAEIQPDGRYKISVGIGPHAEGMAKLIDSITH